MPTEFVKLSCTSCGASLDIYQDMEIFACTYCGTKLLVQRRGGTVNLKTVEEAIGRVQIGTDKTAAELALNRYGVELENLKKQRKSMEKQTEADKNPFAARGCGGGCGFLGLLFIIAGITATNSEGVGMSIIFGIIGILVGVGLFYALSPQNIEEHKVKLESLKAEIIELEGRIEEQRRIADS